MVSKKVLLDKISEAQILGIFKKFCKKNSTYHSKMRLRNIYSLSSDKITTTSKLIFLEQNIVLTKEETIRMYQLINSFLYKSSYRKPIDLKIKKKLLVKQEYKCAICNSEIKHKSHLDHIVPFKYVGDELDDNWQILCKTCNEKKNDSLDYQVKYFFKLV